MTPSNHKKDDSLLHFPQQLSPLVMNSETSFQNTSDANYFNSERPPSQSQRCPVSIEEIEQTIEKEEISANKDELFRILGGLNTFQIAEILRGMWRGGQKQKPELSEEGSECSSRSKCSKCSKWGNKYNKYSKYSKYNKYNKWTVETQTDPVPPEAHIQEIDNLELSSLGIPLSVLHKYGSRKGPCPSELMRIIKVQEEIIENVEREKREINMELESLRMEHNFLKKGLGEVEIRELTQELQTYKTMLQRLVRVCAHLTHKNHLLRGGEGNNISKSTSYKSISTHSPSKDNLSSTLSLQESRILIYLLNSYAHTTKQQFRTDIMKCIGSYTLVDLVTIFMKEIANLSRVSTSHTDRHTAIIRIENDYLGSLLTQAIKHQTILHTQAQINVYCYYIHS